MYSGGAKQNDSMVASLSRKLGQADETNQCWEANWTAFRLFAALSTQWFVGFGGKTGLRYEAIRWVFEEFRIDEQEYADMMRDLRTMEYAALGAMSKK